VQGRSARPRGFSEASGRARFSNPDPIFTGVAAGTIDAKQTRKGQHTMHILTKIALGSLALAGLSRLEKIKSPVVTAAKSHATGAKSASRPKKTTAPKSRKRVAAASRPHRAA
jgi:hypothetical protein